MPSISERNRLSPRQEPVGPDRGPDRHEETTRAPCPEDRERRISFWEALMRALASIHT